MTTCGFELVDHPPHSPDLARDHASNYMYFLFPNMKKKIIVLVKQDSIRQFPGCPRIVSSTAFPSPELLIQCGFIWKETMQLVSGKNLGCVPSFIAVVRPLLSQPMNFSAHPRSATDLNTKAYLWF